MRDNINLTPKRCCCWLMLTIVALASCSYAKPLENQSSTNTDTELRDLNAPFKNKTATVTGAEEDFNANSDSAELTQRAFAHRDEDQLNTATNIVLARNYKYDVEILESGDGDDNDDDNSQPSAELEERFKGHGLYETDTFSSDNIEMTPIDVQSNAINQSHMLLSIVLVVLALLSVGLYAALVIWRSYLEQRYGMRERLVNQDVDEEGIDDVDYHVSYPHTLSPYAPTTTTTMPRA